MAIDYSHVRPPLEVFALTDNMTRATGSIPYTSLTWSRRFTKPGQFELVVPSSVFDTSWRYVYCDDRPELGMVQKVEFSDTAHTPDGVDTVTLSGFFLEQMLNNVVFLDEQPETQLVETEPPKAVMQRISSMPTVYQDPVGDWYYTNLSGDVVKAGTGEVMTDLTGLTEQEYTMGGRQIGNSDYQQANGGSYLYWSDDQHETISVIKYPGNTDTYDVLFEDDRGNAYFLFNGHQLWEAAGIVDVLPGSEPTYRTYAAKFRDWKNNVNGIRYKEVTVKGPWQRTDTMEPITEGDSVQIALKWAQRFLGNSIIYAEPDFEGIQKMVDPSFQYLGDLMYTTLNEVGASLRLEYSYLYNTCTLECYKGLDRTQRQSVESASAATPMMLSARSADYPVPDGYTALGYIKGTGTQYIDTGFYPNNDSTIEVDGFYDAVADSSSQSAFGSRNGNDSHFWEYMRNTNNTMAAYYGTNDAGRLNDVYGTERSVHKIDKNVYMAGDSSHTFTYQSFSIPYTAFLFATNNRGAAMYPARYTMYYAKVYDNGSLIRDFVPARRESDSIVGMYDVVNNVFYTNSGTGSFVAGPDIARPVPDQLSYSANDADATGSMEPTQGYQGEIVVVAECGFAVSGKSFTGWGTNASGGAIFQPGDNYTLTEGDDVLYAQWEQGEDPGPTPEPSGENPWAVFSDTWGTIYDYSASEDTSNYKNTCLVLYDYDKPKSFDEDGMPSYGENKATVDTSAGTAWATTSVYIPYDRKRGYQTQRLDGTDDEPDIETYLDLRDEKPSCDNQWSRETVDVESPYGDEQIEAAVEKLYSVEGNTGDNPGVRAIVDMESIYGAYEGDLETRGTEYLKESYCTVTNLDTGVVDTYGYLRDWDLGDLVEMEVSAVGLVKQARIVAVDEVYESGSSKISIEIGEEKLDTIKKAVLTAKGR